MDTTVKIIPAIMPNDYEEFSSKASLVKGLVEWVQLDVMDSKYTKSISWPYSNADHFDDILSGDEGLPFWEDFDYELDLMVSNPYDEALKWASTGVSRIILHLKTIGEGDFEKLIDDLKDLGVEVGIAILPNEDYSKIANVISKIDCVQFMGIDKVGFQNQKFSEDVLKNISDFKIKYPEMPVSVDGAVDLETADKLVEAGVERLVSGSFIFEGSPEENIKELEEFLKND